MSDYYDVTNALPAAVAGVGIVFLGFMVILVALHGIASQLRGSLMTRKHGLWATCICLTVGTAIAFLVWSASMQSPAEVTGDPPPAELANANKPELPPALLIAPHPREILYGIIRGDCGYDYFGGPNHLEELPEERGSHSQAIGISVEVFDQLDNKKVAGAVSGKDGKFEIHLHPGTYRVVANYEMIDREVGRVIQVESGKEIELRLRWVVKGQ